MTSNALSSTSSQGRVILFKTPSSSTDQDQDPYAQALGLGRGYQARFVQVLQETYEIGELGRIIRGGAGRRGGGKTKGKGREEDVVKGTGKGKEKAWEGVVITSRRGAEGWVRAVQSVPSSSATPSSFTSPKSPGYPSPTRDCPYSKNDHEPSPDTDTDTDTKKHKLDSPGWNDVPLYSVGTAARDHLSHADAGLPDRYRLGAVEMGDGPAKSARALAQVILDTPARFPHSHHHHHGMLERTDDVDNDDKHHDDGCAGHGLDDHDHDSDSDFDDEYGPYLFLCGDKALDELPSLLRAEGREVREIVVYKTTARDDIEAQLEAIIDESAPDYRVEQDGMTNRDGNVDERTGRQQGAGEKELKGKSWLAFFSPSSAAYVLPHLSDHTTTDLQTDMQDKPKKIDVEDSSQPGTGQWHPSPRWKDWKIFAIGETTAAYLRERGVRVDAVAEKPSAEGLAEAIGRADGADVRCLC